MSKNSDLHSISVRIKQRVWRGVEAQKSEIKRQFGVEPSTNGVLVSLIEDGLALRSMVPGVACLPGWRKAGSAAIWTRRDHGYVLQVQPADKGDGWKFLIYPADTTADEITYESRMSFARMVGAMIYAERRLLARAWEAK